MTQSLERDLKSELAFAKIAAFITAPIGIVGFGILLYQTVLWLGTGAWASMPLREYVPMSLRMASFNWPLFEEYYFKVLNFELGLCVAAIGTTLFYLSMRSWRDCSNQLASMQRMRRMRQ